MSKYEIKTILIGSPNHAPILVRLRLDIQLSDY